MDEELEQPQALPVAATDKPTNEMVDQTTEEERASPEEQADYDEFVQACMDLIYVGEDDSATEVRPELLAALEPAREAATAEAGNPAILAAANAAVQIVQTVDTASFEQERPFSTTVVIHALVEIIEQIIEIAETAGLHDYTEEEMNGTLFQALDLYRPIMVELGRATNEELQAEFLQIIEADEAGKLGELMPQFAGVESNMVEAPPPGQI